MKDLDTWIQVFAITAVFIIIMLVISGCQLYDRDKSFDSSCTAKCETCNKLELKCDHIQVDDQTYTQNHPSEPHDTEDK